jgi:Tol biopolymer transport system component
MPRQVATVTLAALMAAVVACTGDDLVAPATGSLRVVAATSGPPIGTLGYTIQVDTRLPERLAASSTVLLTGLAAGEHRLSLGDVGGNCSVEGENPRTVQILANDTTTVTFSVGCSPTVGTIRITISTGGAFPDPDGYEVTLDGSRHGMLGPSGEFTSPGLGLGTHRVELSGVASNCVLAGESSRSVEVAGGLTSLLAFVVDCSAAPPIAFVTDAFVGAVITLVNPDGSGLTHLPHQGLGEAHPVWSPDRSRIAFESQADLYVMNPDGTGRTRLTSDLWILDDFRWSPDGSSLAVSVYDCPKFSPDDCLTSHIWLVRADGAGATRLTDGARPSWSPDGRTIAFGSLVSFAMKTIHADGSGLTTLDVPGAFSPQWSPDGTRIAFLKLRAGVLEILTINPDGTGVINVTQGRGYDRGVVWSPDGRRIAFETSSPDDLNSSTIGLSNADGTSRVILTSNPSGDYLPAWSPDGRHIAFVRNESFPSFGAEIYVVSDTGGAATDVNNNPDVFDSDPVWSSK